MYGSTHQLQALLRCSDVLDLLTDNISIHACWSEHILSLFSANRGMQDTDIHGIPQLPLKQELDNPPTLNETNK